MSCLRKTENLKDKRASWSERSSRSLFCQRMNERGT